MLKVLKDALTMPKLRLTQAQTCLTQAKFCPNSAKKSPTPSIQYKGFENSFSTGLPLDRPKFSVFNTLRKPLAVNNNFLLCHPVINSCSIVDHVFFCIFNFAYKSNVIFCFFFCQIYV